MENERKKNIHLNNSGIQDTAGNISLKLQKKLSSHQKWEDLNCSPEVLHSGNSLTSRKKQRNRIPLRPSGSIRCSSGPKARATSSMGSGTPPQGSQRSHRRRPANSQSGSTRSSSGPKACVGGPKIPSTPHLATSLGCRAPLPTLPSKNCEVQLQYLALKFCSSTQLLV